MYEGLTLRANARNVSFQSLYGGQSALSTQLINPKFCILNKRDKRRFFDHSRFEVVYGLYEFSSPHFDPVQHGQRYLLF